MKVQSLNHLHINVTDMKRSVDFYTRLLGLEQTWTIGKTMTFLSTTSGDLFTLHKVSKAKIDTGDLDHFGFGVKAREHAKAIREAKANGIEVLEVGTWPGGQR